jgi:2-dehydropantoate 2-reductase
LPFMGAATILVSLQNGINEELIAGIVGDSRTIGSVVHYGAGMVGPGHARAYALEAGIQVGALDGSADPRLQELASLVLPPIAVEITNDIWDALWSKLMVNIQVNALCALTGRVTGEVARDPITRQLAIWLAREAITVAQTLGISLDSELLDAEPDMYLRIDRDAAALEVIERGFVDRWGGFSVKPSMLRDAEKGRPTEIEALNGYIVRKGLETGVSVATNEAVVDLVRLQEDGSDFESLGEGLGQAHTALVGSP